MCSRYSLTAAPAALRGRFALKLPPPWSNRAEVRPTDAALVIGTGGARLLRWGLPVSWDKRPLINARAESLASRDTFRPLLQSRVLVPASWWWEWRVEAAGGKTRMRLWPQGEGPFALAGLAAGDRFTIITCAAAPAIRSVHDRMPVVLPRAAEAAWQDSQIPFAQVAPALVPYQGELAMEADPQPQSFPGPVVQGDLFG